jgi:chromosome segregation ATPase
MDDTTVQSAFEREVETYREAMDDLKRTAAGQRASFESLDDAMSELQQSIAQMTDAVDEYDQARDELDAAVVSLGDHAAASRSVEVGDASATGVGLVASD